jgi:hypothetical protein
MLLRRRWWFDYTTPDGEYQIGWCSSRSEARRYARLLGGRYQGRWKEIR